MNKKILILTIAFMLAVMVITLLNGRLEISSDVNYEVGASNGLEVIANITLDSDARLRCMSINQETNRVYVYVEDSNDFTDGIIVIDGETDKIISAIPLDDVVFDIDINPKTNRVYALQSGGPGLHPRDNVVIEIDGATNVKLREIDSPLGYNIGETLAVNPVTNLIYIGVGSEYQGEYDQIQVYSGENLELITTINITASYHHYYRERVDLDINPNTNKIYARWSGDNLLYLIDGNTHKITKTIQLEIIGLPIINPYTSNLYFSRGSYEYLVLNGETLEEIGSVNVLGFLKAVDEINNILYTERSGESAYFGDRLSRIDGLTHESLDSLLLPDDVWVQNVAANPKSSKIYISTLKNSIYVVSTSAEDSEPIISLLSPENKTYSTRHVPLNVPLNFTTSETLIWAQYSLDGEANQTILYSVRNTTLPSLSEGEHTIVVYGEDLSENVGQSQLVHFSIQTIRSELPVDPILVIVLIATALTAVVLTLVWQKKRKKT